MCGIFTLIHQPNYFNSSFIKTQFEKGKNRGPEDSKLMYLGCEVTIGFHRLAINGLNNTNEEPDDNKLNTVVKNFFIDFVIDVDFSISTALGKL